MSRLESKKEMVAKQIGSYLNRTQNTQLPFKAHTSTNAKIGIAVSLVSSVVALAAVAALVTTSMARSVLPEYRRKGEELMSDIKDNADIAKDKVVSKAKGASAEVKKVKKTVKDSTADASK